MIEILDNIGFDDGFQLIKVDQITGFGIDFSGQSDFKFVVVPVIMRVIAYTELLDIAFVTPGGIVEPVSGVKMCCSKYCNFHGRFGLKEPSDDGTFIDAFCFSFIIPHDTVA